MDITHPIHSDANKARELLEALHWPNGPVCPHCGNCDAECTAEAVKGARCKRLMYRQPSSFAS